MERYLKYSAEEKINAIKESLDGKASMSSIAKRLYIKFQSFQQCVKNYEVLGTDAFSMYQNKRHLKPEKEQAVVAYLLTYRYLQKI